MDFLYYFLRITWLLKHSEEKNLARFIHAFIHIAIISVWIQILVFVITHGRKESGGLFIILPILGIRVLVYSIMTITIIVFLPCLMIKMAKKWRARAYMLPQGHLNANREALLQQYEEFMQLRAEFRRRMQVEYGIQNGDAFVVNFNQYVNNNEAVPRFNNIDDLKRIEPSEVGNDLPYDECPICIESL